MKKHFYILLLLLYTSTVVAQTVTVKLSDASEHTLKDDVSGKVEIIDIQSNDIKSFDIKGTAVGNKIKCNDDPTINDLPFGNSYTNISSSVNFHSFQFQAKKADGSVICTFKFVYKKVEKGNTADKNKSNSLNQLPNLSEYIRKNYKFSSENTVKGLIASTTTSGNYLGDHFIHILLDQNGNSLLSVIPQGIANNQYVVHVFYYVDLNGNTDITYAPDQSRGSFISTLVFNNAGETSKLSDYLKQNDNETAPVHNWVIREQEFLLRTSTDNIEFTLYKTETDLNTGKSVTTKLTTHQVAMTKYYYGSIDVGFVYSGLSNPTYSLLPLPNTTNQTVKKSGGDGGGVVLIVARFYTSIPRLFQPKKFTKFERFGRNFLDDHGILERIFPMVGIGVRDKSVENFILGLDWEIARGLSVSGGLHLGHVNYFDSKSLMESRGGQASDFKYGQTTVSQDEFNLYSDKRWRAGWFVGVSIDPLVLFSIFK